MAVIIRPPQTLFGPPMRTAPVLTPEQRRRLVGLTGGTSPVPDVIPAAHAGWAGAGPGHWNMPDYNALLAGDPTLMSAIAQIAASGSAAGREKTLATRRAITQFGAVPTGLTHVGDIDEATRLAAEQNPLSTVRQQEEARSRSRADLAAALAGRGMLQSGALAGGEQRVQEGFERARGTATQQLLDALGGYESSFAQAQRELALAEMAAREQAASRVMGTYLPTWEEGGGLVEPPGGRTDTAPRGTLAPPPLQTALLTPEMRRRLQQQALAAATRRAPTGYQRPI
jgi:hypothetical protein